MKSKLILVILIIILTGCNNVLDNDDDINTYIYKLINDSKITIQEAINSEVNLTLNDLINKYNYIYTGNCDKDKSTIKIVFDDTGKVIQTIIDLSCNK